MASKKRLLPETFSVYAMIRKTHKILVVDVGNTSTLFGYYDGPRLRKTFRLPTKSLKPAKLLVLKRKFPLNQMEAAVVATVVPAAGKMLKKSLPRLLGLKTLLAGQDIQVPIQNRYRHPKQVGMDRLMNALAAFIKYRRDVIIMDFGTAITFDVVSRKGEYLGGVIAPGVEISLEALYQKTALLPNIRLTSPKSAIGRDTVESIRIGCSIGIGGLCDRIVEKIKRRFRRPPLVIATGGQADFIAKYCKTAMRIEPSLTLQGLWLSYRHHLKKT